MDLDGNGVVSFEEVRHQAEVETRAQVRNAVACALVTYSASLNLSER